MTEGPKYPKLYPPRPVAGLVIGASRDARWADVPSNIESINRLRVHELQLKKRAKLRRAR